MAKTCWAWPESGQLVLRACDSNPQRLGPARAVAAARGGAAHDVAVLRAVVVLATPVLLRSREPQIAQGHALGDRISDGLDCQRQPTTAESAATTWPSVSATGCTQGCGSTARCSPGCRRPCGTGLCRGRWQSCTRGRCCCADRQ
ncbi:hypothetical protein DL89DRAFT_27038 [Linderina pennispora]|uniref:Uncharacterized protein n=1 Tax=Linderina pennispora TaxID=61395 RepID=A0A1Y1W478_9FUNG|nr:uncharacterized protein DL89DRAFT_27038 [Linderina pennispora]ORX68125.1 hypothetical protein DL89DRAFT_27038 [Linderina pennispora]